MYRQQYHVFDPAKRETNTVDAVLDISTSKPIKARCSCGSYYCGSIYSLLESFDMTPDEIADWVDANDPRS